MANTERCLKLASLISRANSEKTGSKLGFHMGYWFTGTDFWSGAFELLMRDAAVPQHCSTVGCMAGWAVAAFQPKRNGRPLANSITAWITARKRGGRNALSVPREAAKLLGLTEYEQADLFCPAHISDRTNKEAAAVLRHFARTGEILWDCFDKAGKPLKTELAKARIARSER